MRVLWITYCDFPEAVSLCYGKSINRLSGGWLQGAADGLLSNTAIELRIASVSRLNTEFRVVKGTRITYYLIPFHKGIDSYHHCFDEYWRAIQTDFNPEVVHVHGVESSIGLSYLRVLGPDRVVLSIQGLAGVIGRYYNEGLSDWEIIKNISIGDILRRKTLFTRRSDFLRKGIIEEETLREARHVIGRTQWDKSHCQAVNPNLEYHFCNETMREQFYSGSWDYNSCRRHSIFLSSMAAPFKGAHFVLKALPFIMRKYPDVQVRIAGGGLVFPASAKDFLRQSGYERYLSGLIRKYSLKENIKLLGPLNAEGMKKEYLGANVFICPSTMENSSNSIAEAQLLGVPVIASYVGGTPDLIPSSRCGQMFRSGEYEMLASFVIDLFERSRDFDNTTERTAALDRHDPVKNAQALYEIYTAIDKTNN